MLRHPALRLTLIVLLVAGCAPAESTRTDAAVRGRVILWHAWPEAEAQALYEALDAFAGVYPDVRIVRSRVPADQIVERYQARASMGLGPDLLLIPGHRVPSLAESGLIRPLDDSGIDTDRYHASVLQTLRHNGALYGLPVSLHTAALYYNRELTDTPPATLDELLVEAGEGRAAAITTGFFHAFWGISAFGGRALDEEGRVVLDQGGFANWLGWLKLAQDSPGIVMTGSHDVAQALFMEGRVAYYVGTCAELSALREALGDDLLGVAPLPAGPYGPAGPLLEVEALVVNASSSANQVALATQLARHITSAEQQMRLARQAGRVPANAQVRIDVRLLPQVAGFMAQARTAVPRPSVPQMNRLITEGDRTYALALEGLLTVAEAARALAEETNAAYGFAPAADSAGEQCELEGTLVVRNALPDDRRSAIDRLTMAFMRSCPGVYVTVRQAARDGLEAYLESARARAEHDILAGPAEWIPPLVSEGIIRDVADVLGNDLMQRYRPAANEALIADGTTYGVPLSLRTQALYYNPDLVNAPPDTLDDLLAAAGAGHGLALRLDARNAFWALGATGGLDIDPEGRPVLEASAVSAWIAFLRRLAETPNVVVAADDSELRRAFAEGHAAYMIGDNSHLGPLQTTVGSEGVRVTGLPAGPGGKARPLLQVDALMFPTWTAAQRAPLAAGFAQYASDTDAQRDLASRTGSVPANINVSLDDLAAVSVFAAQVEDAVVPRWYPDGESPWQIGDELIAAALAGEETDALEEAFLLAFNAQSPAHEEPPDSQAG